jgi:GxxExxY protein
MTENEISKMLIGIFINIHSEPGPGLLESVYEEVTCHELKKRPSQTITHLFKAY